MPLIARKKDSVPEAGQRRVSAQAAGYMELEGAKKDAKCAVVEVKNGISSDLGCCNLFSPTKGVAKFSCGTCEYKKAI